MDYAKKIKLRFRVGESGPTSKKEIPWYTSSREEEGVDAHSVPVWHNNRD